MASPVVTPAGRPSAETQWTTTLCPSTTSCLFFGSVRPCCVWDPCVQKPRQRCGVAFRLYSRLCLRSLSDEHKVRTAQMGNYEVAFSGVASRRCISSGPLGPTPRLRLRRKMPASSTPPCLRPPPAKRNPVAGRRASPRGRLLFGGLFFFVSRAVYLS